MAAQAGDLTAHDVPSKPDTYDSMPALVSNSSEEWFDGMRPVDNDSPDSSESAYTSYSSEYAFGSYMKARDALSKWSALAIALRWRHQWGRRYFLYEKEYKNFAKSCWRARMALQC